MVKPCPGEQAQEDSDGDTGHDGIEQCLVPMLVEECH